MTEHAKRAQKFAERIQALGISVTYPGLSTHPDRELLEKQRCADYGYGGLLTLDLGSKELANELMDVLQNRYRFGFMAVYTGTFEQRWQQFENAPRDIGVIGEKVSKQI